MSEYTNPQMNSNTSTIPRPASQNPFLTSNVNSEVPSDIASGPVAASNPSNPFSDPENPIYAHRHDESTTSSKPFPDDGANRLTDMSRPNPSTHEPIPKAIQPTSLNVEENSVIESARMSTTSGQSEHHRGGEVITDSMSRTSGESLSGTTRDTTNPTYDRTANEANVSASTTKDQANTAYSRAANTAEATKQQANKAVDKVAEASPSADQARATASSAADRVSDAASTTISTLSDMMSSAYITASNAASQAVDTSKHVIADANEAAARAEEETKRNAKEAALVADEEKKIAAAEQKAKGAAEEAVQVRKDIEVQRRARGTSTAEIERGTLTSVAAQAGTASGKAESKTEQGGGPGSSSGGSSGGVLSLEEIMRQNDMSRQ